MEFRMLERRDVLVVGALSVLAQLLPKQAALGADNCQSVARAELIGNALLDRYATAINAHDTSSFPELFTQTYIQHSGRSPSGLTAQIDNFQRILATMPDLRLRIEDRIIAGDKVVARNTYAATTHKRFEHRANGQGLLVQDHRYLARRGWKVCRALGSHRYRGGLKQTSRG